MSFDVEPTRLFAALTTPTVGPLPLSHVAAPASTTAPLSKPNENATTLPFWRAIAPVDPTASFAVPPIMLFAGVTAPTIPVVPFPHVIAPTCSTGPLFHTAEYTT